MENNDIIKTCENCAYRRGTSYNYGNCMLTGVGCMTERQYPTLCGKHFEGWVRKPKRKSLKRWLLELWYGE